MDQWLSQLFEFKKNKNDMAPKPKENHSCPYRRKPRYKPDVLYLGCAPAKFLTFKPTIPTKKQK